MFKLFFALALYWALAVSPSRQSCTAGHRSLCVTCGGGNAGCPQTKYLFPNDKQTTDYIRVKTPVQQMSKVTVCAWLTPLPEESATGSIFSYATPEESNTLLLFFGNSEFSLYIDDYMGDVDLVIKTRTHICTTFNKPNAMIYVDGELKKMITYSNSNVMKEGGALIIGQEQDTVVGSFTDAQAFSGTIENLMLWYEVLSGEQIKALFRDPCNCPGEYGIALTPDAVQLEGGVLAQPIDQC